MKNQNNKLLSIIIITIVFSILWFLFVNWIFTLPEIQVYYQNPNVIVQLSKHLIGLNGISESDDDQLEWTLIEECRVVGRRNGNVELSKDFQAYVDPEKTIIRDTLTSDQHVLSSKELDDFFINVCSDREFELEYNNIPKPTFGLLPSEFTIDINGRYEGIIVLTTNRIIPESETNIDQVWNASPRLPWFTILGCLFSTVVLAVIVFLSLCKCSNYKLTISIVSVVVFVLILALYFYSVRSK